MGGIWQGVISLKSVKNVPLFIFYTLGIWVSYFLHYYLTFFCFDFTSSLGFQCALVTFVVGSIAVIVPTPNGAGPWHFAVKTMLILYGVSDTNASTCADSTHGADHAGHTARHIRMGSAGIHQEETRRTYGKKHRFRQTYNNKYGHTEVPAYGAED